MKKLLAMLAAAMGIATGAEAVTTNRVTVLNKSGSATSEGSLAYWIKNAPINGNVLEITLIDDPQEPESGTYGGDGGYMLDEPLTILSGQKIIVRCVPNPGTRTFPGYRLLERVIGGQGGASGGPLVEITGALCAACDAQGKSPFTIQSGGFLRFERVSLENWGDGIDYYIGHSMFTNSGALELAHCGVQYYHDQVQGGILRSYTGSTTLFYGCTIDSCSPTRKGDPTRNPNAVDGGAVYSSGGRFTMVNSEGLQRIYAKNGFYFTGSETESLFVNCALEKGFMYDNIADGKHHIISGTILGYNSRLKWENDFNDWKRDRDVPWYQVECSGSGKPVIRDCVIAAPGSGDGGNIFPTSWAAELVGCIEKESGLTPGGNELTVARDLYGSYFKPWVNGACNIYAPDTFLPNAYLSTGAAGAQIWHDAEWRNVVGEDTERFVIRGDAAKATQRLDEDFLGKPISADHRPVPQHIQWNEPTLTVDASGRGIAMLLAYRFMPSENYDERFAMLGGANLLWGRTTLQDAVEYAVEDWRRGAGNRRLIGADGAYHINFADNLKGKTVSVHGVMRVRDGIKIVIDGEGTTLEVGEPDEGVEGASRIFDVSGGELVLSNLTLKGGCADGSWHFYGSDGFDAYNDVCEGGAIRVGSGYTISGYSVEGKVTVDNCRFEDCTAKNAGGAICVNGDYCSATVRNSSFVRCGLTDPSSGSGGAIFVGGSTGAGPSMGLVVENCTFSECGGSAAKSDAVHIGKRSEVEMTGVVIADGENGGVYVDDSARSAAITNAIIVGKSGPDISGAVAKITGGDIAYGSSSGVIWAEGSRQVTRDEVLAPAAFQEEEVGGVPQAYYALVGEPYPVDISEFTGGGTKTIGDAAVISGTLGSVCKVQIADGATVTLKDATIEGVDNAAYKWAGLTCEGDATIILEGANVVKGFESSYPGIYVPEGKTLTIRGEGSLDASSNGYGAGIGAGFEVACGNIVIEGGVITAAGGGGCAGIGGGYGVDSGDIVITGGQVSATGGENAAGIGSGEDSACGGITISGGTVEATGGKFGAGIGGGDYGECDGIAIGIGVTRVAATSGTGWGNPIGAGHFGADVAVTVASVLSDKTSGSTRTIEPIFARGAAFEETDVVVNEGGAITIVVNGGSEDGASSAKVYLTYNTAVAADLDLAKGTVDGVTPKGGLKFPLALAWEAGDTTPRTVVIPVKADKAVEDGEFFTLQLAETVGIGLGENRLCTACIHDPGYDELEAKIAAGTATKAEQTAWNKLQAAKAPYIRGLANPANAGKVTGSGYCPDKKKVTLKATANKGWVFVSWKTNWLEEAAIAKTPSLVIDRTAKPAANSATSMTLAGIAESTTFFAEFVTSDVDKGSIEAGLNGVRLEDAAYQTNVWAGVYLEWPIEAAALSQTTVKVAGLPAGLKFTAKDIVDSKTKQVTVPANTIYGAPTAASKAGKDGKPVPSDVKITVTTAGKSSVTYLVKLMVDPLPAWAVGTFDGEVEGGGIVQAFTVASSGKISGKMLEGGRTWTLSAANFSRVEHVEGDVVFHATVIGKAGKEVVASEVTVSAENGIGVATALLPFHWAACQNLWKRADTKASQPVFKTNIAVDYLFGAEDDKNNTVKMTFKKDGAVSFSGKIGGVSVSGSAQLVWNGEDWQVTFYAPPKPTAKPPFAGWCETFDVKLTTDGQNIVTKAEFGEAEHDKVQLWEGGPYWATTNIGAKVPEDYGYYFWWGDVVGYKWQNERWVASNGASSGFSFGGGNVQIWTFDKDVATLHSAGWITAGGVLAPEHDAAQAHWGGEWRMPTDEEMQALCSNCNWAWATLNGVRGYVVRGRGVYASNSIFLPCAGYGREASFYAASTDGNYWSSFPYSNPGSDNYYSSYLCFFSSNEITNLNCRYYGMPIRPVQDAE